MFEIRSTWCAQDTGVQKIWVREFRKRPKQEEKR